LNSYPTNDETPMSPKLLNKKVKQLLKSVTNKRAHIVIEHILVHGFITTEELEKKYGYNHPPRAARDVREACIPLETFRVQSSDGRSIAAYKFGDLTKIRKGRLEGRKTFPKKLKDELYEISGGKCAICSGRAENISFTTRLLDSAGTPADIVERRTLWALRLLK